MKKLSFFLMAMLFSVMSFATEVTVSIADYATANGWVDATAYNTLTMDEVVTVTANPTTGTYNNTGKYYDNGKNWRMYQNEAPAITVSAAEGYLLTSVTFTYESNKTGVMVDAAGAQVASGTAVALDKVASATFSVSNTDAAVTNGQARITAITVTYEAAVVEPTTETVYFINTKKWTKVNAYAWNTGGNNGWPGAAATKEAEQIAGYDVYSFTANASQYANVIFNDGSSQTADLVWTAGQYYVMDMGWMTKEEAETKLAAPLPDVWNIVGAAGLMGTDWNLNDAKNAMTLQADGTYLLEKKDITLTAGTYEYKAAKDHGWTVSVPQGSGNQKLTISTSGTYDVTFVLDVTAKKLTATATLKQAAVVIPTIQVAGEMTSWGDAPVTLVMAADSLTATATIKLDAKPYLFKMIVGGNWQSDAKTVNRDNNSTVFTGANSDTNTTLVADQAGDYIFTWEYATKTLTVTYPAIVEEPSYDLELPVTISNLTTSEMPVGEVKYLQLMGSNDMEGVEVMLFIPNYTGENKEYALDLTSYMLTLGGTELTLVEGALTKSTDAEKGDVFAGRVVATGVEEGETFTIALDLTMWSTPATEIEIEDVTITVDEESAIALFTATWEGAPLSVEVSGFEEVEFKEYIEATLTLGDDVNWVDAAFGPVAVIIEDGVAMLEGEFTSFATGKSYEVTLTGTLPAKPAPLKGVVKRAVQLGESVVVLTHEADGTAYLYNIVGEEITEISQEGVIAVDTTNAGDYLAISDIAATEDGKLVAINYMQTQSGDDNVDAGYKRGETRVYLWNDLAGDPAILFTSKMSSNWFRSKQGLTMAVKGTSNNMEIFTTGIHATSAWARTSSYRVIDGVYTEPDVNNNDNYHFYDVADAVALETTVGTQYELNASPLGAMNWILDAELINPVEIVEPETNNVEISTCVALTQDLGKKYQGVSVVTVDEQVLMVAPYANAEGLLAGVKVLDVTAGLAADSVVATLELDAPVAATAAATAVEVAAYDVNITLVADGYIYNLVYNLPKPERTETTVLNPFAYNLSSELSEDNATLTVNYTLNANAEAVEILIMNGEEVVKTVPVRGINKGAYTVKVPTAGLPAFKNLTWSVNVKGTSVEAPTQLENNYGLYCPHGLAIDTNPESENFGRILVADAMNIVKDKTGYLGSGIGAGLHVFTPSFTTDSVVYTGGNDFTRIWESNGYQPWRVKISEDGRIFVSSLDLNGVVVWEVSKDLQTWTPVIAGTQGEDGNILDAEGNFVAGMNVSMDVKGSGEDLTLLLYSCTTGAAAFSQSAFRLDEYALGTATTWTGTPKNILTGGKYALIQTNAEWIYDGEGGYWFGASRGGNAGQPNLAHINANGEEDFRDETTTFYGGDGVMVHNGMLFKGKARTNSSTGNFGVYTIGKDADGKVTLTEKWSVVANGIGRNLNEFAVDYAENLYVVGNSGEMIIAYAMPYSGEVATPAASKYAFELTGGIEFMSIEEEVTDLLIDTESMTMVGTGMMYGFEINLAIQDNLNGTFAVIPENSFVTLNGTDAKIIDGEVFDVDITAPTATAVVKIELGGEYFEVTFNMSNTPVEVIDVVIENATVAVNEFEPFPGAPMKEHSLTMTANWTNPADQETYPVKVEVPVYYPEATEPSEMLCTVTIGGMGDTDPWLGFGEGYLTITTVNGVVTATGLIENAGTGFAANVTISGKLSQGPTTGLDNIQLNVETIKVIKNGQLIIIKNGVEYNVQGAVL